MRRWVPIFVLTLLAAVLAGSLTADAIKAGRASDVVKLQDDTTRKTERPPPSPLFIPDDQIDVGDVWEATKASVVVPIHNRTDQDIYIKDFDSCDCEGIVPRQLTVPAHGSADVRIDLDLTRRSPAHVGLAKRVFRTTLRPVLPSGERTSPLEIRGTVKSRSTFNLGGVQFGDSNVAGQPPHSRKLIVTVHVPCDGIVAVADDASLFSSFHVARLDQNRFQLTLAPDNDRKPGPFRTTVRVYDQCDTERRTVLTGIGVDGQLCER